MKNNRRTLSSLALMLMTFTAVFSFGNIIDSSVNIGLATIPSYIFATVFYFFPFALMIGEFASACGESESGINSWIKKSLGARWAFLGSWSYFFVNLFFFSSLLPRILIYASYTFTGKNYFEGKKILIALISVVLFWGVTFISTKGVSWIAKITNLSGVAKIILGFGFILLSFGAILLLGKAPAQEFTAETILPKFNWTYFMVLAWILQAVGGAESIGVYIKDVKGGNRVFIRTMLISTFVLGLFYALGALSIGLIVPAETLKGNFSNGLFDSFSILGSLYGVATGISTRVVGFIMMLASLGSLVIWTAAPVKVLFSEIPEGIFGKWVAKTDEKGNPYNALYLQAIVVTVLLMVPALGIGSVDSFLEMLITMTASTSLIPVLFFLIGYIVLRAKKDTIERSFKVGGKKFGVVLGGLLLALFVFVFIVSSIPSPGSFSAYFSGTLEEGATNPLFVLLYNVLGLVIFLGFAEICWRKYEKRVGKAAANELGHNKK